jgi:hypothetical protein
LTHPTGFIATIVRRVVPENIMHNDEKGIPAGGMPF